MLKKRLGSILLTLALLVGLLPWTVMPARARGGPEGAGKAIRLGADVLATGKNTADAATVWFGAKAENETTAPIAWRVVGYGADDFTSDSAAGSMTLLAAGNIDQAQYAGSGSNAYADSTLKTKVDAIAGAFSAAEQAAVEARTLARRSYIPVNTDWVSGTAVTGALLWPLSTKEAVGVAEELRRLDENSGRNLATDYWWLRSPGSDNDRAAVVLGYGTVHYPGENVSLEHGVRPAFYLKLSSVLFTSAAAGGKPAAANGGISEIADYDGSAWKLTLLDESRSGFAVTETAASAAPGGTITLTYGGAATGANEYVSLLLCDSTGASVLRYGSSAALTSASGTASFTVPDDLALGSYTLKVFNEQRNGDYKTDYASAFDEVTLSVKNPITPAVTLAGWTYGDVANTPSVSGNTDNGEVTFTYKVKGADDDTYTNAVPTAAGSYTVRATIAETADYVGGTATADFTITLVPSLANGMVTAPQGARLILAQYSGGRMTGMQSVTINADCADADAAKLLGVTLPTSGCKLMLVDGSTYAPLCAAWEG